PHALVLDEPTSALDPAAAEDVLAALQRIVHDLGMTVLMAEHRLERVVQFADRIVHVSRDGSVSDGDPHAMLKETAVAPPVIELGRHLGWAPLPLSIREARRFAQPVRERLAAATLPTPNSWPGQDLPARVTLTSLTASYAEHRVLREINLTVHPGEVVAIMGRNGAGKSTLLRSMVGLTAPTAGRVRLGADDPAQLSPRERARRIGMVPQEPSDLLWFDSVTAECQAADADAGAAAGSAIERFDMLAPGIAGTTHPRDLSEGQRLCLALAVIMTADAPLVLLDEPTRGLDYPTKRRLSQLLADRAANGCAVVLATHDVELVAELTTRTVVLADGDVVADGPTHEVVLGSPQFAPQVAKVLAPLPWLTVGQVAAALPVAG
ncbi:MAG TPA: ATP-binding cassette domain-containing protein, partial [Actinomycetes bacterium]|nr:ATP-binding cassette domain-containing protein [Actinomycetes bacterium]